MSDEKPREFKIIHDQYIATVYSEAEFDSVQNLDTTGEAEVIHVIEYSAYEALKEENILLHKEIHKITNGIPSEWAYAILKKERDELAEKWRITEDANEALKKERDKLRLEFEAMLELAKDNDDMIGVVTKELAETQKHAEEMQAWLKSAHHKDGCTIRYRELCNCGRDLLAYANYRRHRGEK